MTIYIENPTKPIHRIKKEELVELLICAMNEKYPHAILEYFTITGIDYFDSTVDNPHPEDSVGLVYSIKFHGNNILYMNANIEITKDKIVKFSWFFELTTNDYDLFPRNDIMFKFDSNKTDTKFKKLFYEFYNKACKRNNEGKKC